MPIKLLLEYSMFTEMLCAWALLVVLFRKRQARGFSFLAVYAAVSGLNLLAQIGLLYFHKRLGLTGQFTYNCYFYSSWIFLFIGHALMLCIVCQIFRRAMIPFQGLHRLGTMVFKWVGGVAITLVLGIMIVPGRLPLERYIAMADQFEQAISILTICLLLFVCFAIRYLGMTYRSHLFGASLGLGILGTRGLVIAAWTSVHGMAPLYSSPYLVHAVVGVVTLSIWGGYFLLPEPQHEMVLLPTTSPYFHWNQISEALGNDPGVVAVSGFTPDALSPAERLVLGSASSMKKPSIGVTMQVHEHATATGTQL